MNNLSNINELSNRYFVLRHGESRANTKNIIIGDPKNGIFDFGLTEKGMTQVRDSVLSNNELDKDTIIFSSDFKRTKETAEIARAILKISEVHFTELLRERFFGNFEGMDNKNYDIVWESDKISIDSEIENTESINNVLERTTKLVVDLERQFEGEKILLVSHGDPLEILETGFLNPPVFSRDQVAYIKTAEIREIKLKNTTL